MGQKRSGNKGRCPSCKLNNNLCLCESIRPLKIATNVSLIVHVRELTLTSNTAQFVEKLLPDNASISIRGQMDINFQTGPILERPGRPLFLYPHDDALELNEEFKKNFPGPYHLIVPDGNWQGARNVRRREAGFKDLPAVKLPPGIMTEYGLRKAPQPDWLSTFEAVTHALGILESHEITEHMMVFFRLWVKTTFFNRTKDKSFLA